MHIFRLLILYPLLPSSLQPIIGCFSWTTANDRKVQKADEKFHRWIDQHQQIDRDGCCPIVIVDGNNVRGIGKFEWNPVELQHRVADFCHEYRISRAVIVWDHGRSQWASLRRYASSTSSPTFWVDMVILFSGLNQRADDVIVAESKYLNSHFFDSQGWRSMAFVTSDRELNFKLRRQSSSRTINDASHGNSRRDCKSDMKIPTDGPLFCDSFRFLELVERSPQLEWDNNDIVSLEAARAIEEAKASLVQFSKLRRRGVNPRRESTWERCVLAETFRRSLCDSFAMTASIESCSDCYSWTASEFLQDYMRELQESRGYGTPWEIDATFSDDPKVPHVPFQGPTRLDKRQRRLLGSYNSFLSKGGVII